MVDLFGVVVGNPLNLRKSLREREMLWSLGERVAAAVAAFAGDELVLGLSLLPFALNNNQKAQ